MDREYGEIMYGSMFDELDRIQAYRLYTDPYLQKAAGIDPGVLVGSTVQGFKNLAKNPKGFLNVIKGSYLKGSAKGGGVLGGAKRVLSTDEGKALAAGGAGLIGAGALIGSRRRDGNQVVVAR